MVSDPGRLNREPQKDQDLDETTQSMTRRDHPENNKIIEGTPLISKIDLHFVVCL